MVYYKNFDRKMFHGEYLLVAYEKHRGYNHVNIILLLGYTLIILLVTVKIFWIFRFISNIYDATCNIQYSHASWKFIQWGIYIHNKSQNNKLV